MGSDSLPMATPYAMAISFKPVHKHGQTDADPAASVSDIWSKGVTTGASRGVDFGRAFATYP